MVPDALVQTSTSKRLACHTPPVWSVKHHCSNPGEESLEAASPPLTPPFPAPPHTYRHRWTEDCASLRALGLVPTAHCFPSGWRGRGKHGVAPEVSPSFGFVSGCVLSNVSHVLAH